MEKTEWPTQEKLQELRSQGIFVYSPFVTRAAMFIGLIIVLSLLGGKFAELRQLFFKLISTSDLSTNSHTFKEICSLVQVLLVVPAFVVLVFCVFMILFQSRFYFSFGSLSFDPAQALPFRSASFSSLLGKFFRGIFTLLLGISCGFVLAWWGFRDILSIAFATNAAPPNVNSLLLALAAIFMLILVVVAGVSYAFTRLGFMMRNKISRQEAE